ncbi:MAG TPA: aldo/keto reductase [Smithella sp.]|nr:aldo/keto reductase [Smithella sp.]
MIYKEFGKTGIKVSALGFGGLRFLEKDYSTAEGMDRCAQVIIKAVDCGINYFDTAHDYCGNKGEIIFGHAFRQIERSRYYISVKSNISYDPTADDVMRRVENSLKNLCVDYIDFFNMWAIMDLAQYQRIMASGGPYEGALRAKDKGLIKHICFSAHCSGGEIETIVKDGAYAGVTLSYNALNFRYREKGLHAAYAQGLGVVTMNSLAGGMIPLNPDYFSYLCTEPGQSVVDAALRFNAAHNEIAVVLSGMSTKEQVVENVRCFDRPLIVSDRHIKHLKRKNSPLLNTLCTGCNYCAGCPAGLEIHKLMMSYNRYLLSGKNIDEFLESLNKDWEMPLSEKQCLECGECENKCTQHIPIMKRIADINSLLSKACASLKDEYNRCFDREKKQKVGLYAIGAQAKAILRNYLNIYEKIDFPLFLFDGDKKKWGTDPLIPDMYIRPPEDIITMGVKRVVICSELYYDQILSSLIYLEKYGVKFLKFDGSKLRGK